MGTGVVKIFPARDDEVWVGTAGIYGSRWIFIHVNVHTSLPEQHAGVALSALIRALDELQMVAIVRYAYDRRSNPQVGAAFPLIKPSYEVESWI